ASADPDLARQVAGGHGGGHVGDVADLGRQVAGQGVDRVGEVFPGAGHVLDVGLTAEPALGADLARDARDFRCERAELIDHPVDGVLEVEDLAADVDGDLAREVAVGDRLGDRGDVADVGRQVAGHRVDRVGQVLPGAGPSAHVGLAAELAFGANLARDAGDLGGERAELVDHRVDRVLELEDLAADVHRDLLGQVAVRDRLRHVGVIADLRGQVAGPLPARRAADLPGAGPSTDVGLAAEPALGADLAGDARDLGGERAELVDHRVDGVLELEDLALDVDGDLSGEVAVGDGGGDLGDVADLRSQVAGHRVDGVGQISPRAGCALDPRLTAE